MAVSPGCAKEAGALLGVKGELAGRPTPAAAMKGLGA